MDLSTRTGLPDALRLLLEKHPKERWREHKNFDGLTAFWLSRHLQFRDLLTKMRANSTEILDTPNADGRACHTLLRMTDALINALHQHHHIEDTAYFPIFMENEPRLVAGFDLLDKDHHQLHESLDALTDGANDIIETLRANGKIHDPIGRLADQLTGFDRFIDRHLTDEEELVVPIVLEYGPPHI